MTPPPLAWSITEVPYDRPCVDVRKARCCSRSGPHFQASGIGLHGQEQAADAAPPIGQAPEAPGLLRTVTTGVVAGQQPCRGKDAAPLGAPSNGSGNAAASRHRRGMRGSSHLRVGVAGDHHIQAAHNSGWSGCRPETAARSPAQRQLRIGLLAALLTTSPPRLTTVVLVVQVGTGAQGPGVWAEGALADARAWPAKAAAIAAPTRPKVRIRALPVSG